MLFMYFALLENPEDEPLFEEFYNKFYNNNNILNEENSDIKESYLALTKLVYNVIHNLLHILAIDEVERM